MLENRKMNGIVEKTGKLTINPAERKSLKQEIIEKKPKHKKLKEYFEGVIERYVDEDESESE
jgi:hypothetical protein